MELMVDIKKKLQGFTLNVKFKAEKNITGVLGESGSGKSMTLRCIAGIEKPDEGKIILNGRVLFDSEKGVNIPSRFRKVGYLFQNYALFPNMTVEENIGFALGKQDKERKNLIIKQKIEMMKLEGLEKRYPFHLSGGQQQRVALARALAIEPEVLLLDEPFSALDDHLRNTVAKQLIDTLQTYNGVTLFVSHNMEEAYRISNRLVTLKSGGVEAIGEKHNIFLNPPTLAVARLTGCRNISKAKYLSSKKLYATDWGIELSTNKNIRESISHVGIRGHYLRTASDEDIENVLNCWVSYIDEGPFKVIIYLSIEKEPVNSEDYNLQWEISKEKWYELKKQPVPWRILLDTEKILTFDR